MATKRKQIKQKIFATLVVVFMLAMLGGVINLKNVRAIGDNTTLQQVLTGGSLSLESPTQVNFNTLAAGEGANSMANMTQVNMRDYRGTGDGWTATGSANNMQAVNGSIIPNSRLTWAPGDVWALDGASNTNVVAGPDYSANFGTGDRILANTSLSTGDGMGNYVINGTALNLLITADDYAGTYQNTLTITIA